MRSHHVFQLLAVAFCVAALATSVQGIPSIRHNAQTLDARELTVSSAESQAAVSWTSVASCDALRNCHTCVTSKEAATKRKLTGGTKTVDTSCVWLKTAGSCAKAGMSNWFSSKITALGSCPLGVDAEVLTAVPTTPNNDLVDISKPTWTLTAGTHENGMYKHYIATSMYIDKTQKLCGGSVTTTQTASGSTTLTGASLATDWPKISHAFGAGFNAFKASGNAQYAKKLYLTLRHDDRPPSVIFKDGFTTATDPGHPSHRAARCSTPNTVSWASLADHQINETPQTYCHFISTTMCPSVGFYGGHVYAVVVPEGISYVDGIRGEHDEIKDANAEVMAVGSIPASHVFAVRTADIATEDFLDEEYTSDFAKTKIEYPGGWTTPKVLRETQEVHVKVPARKLTYNKDFSVTGVNAADIGKLEKLLHATCHPATGTVGATNACQQKAIA